MQTYSSNDKPSFIRGSRANTISLVYEGFRYTRDGKPTVDGRQAWRCVRKTDKCPGRVYTLGDSTVGTPRPHCHPSNFTECEVNMIYAHAKELRVTSTAPPSQILTAVKRGASEAALLHLPKAESFKRNLNLAKAKENPSPPAPTYF
jgi:hypothetical protein